MEEKAKTSVAVEASSNNQKLRPIGRLFVDSWNIFVEGWIKFLLIFLIGIAIFIGVGICAVLLFFIPFLLVKGIIGIAIGIILSIVPIVIFAIVVNLASVKLVYGVCLKDGSNIVDSLKYGFKYFGSFLWVSLIAGLLIILGYVFLIIPGIIIGIILCLVTPIFVIEEKHNLGALRRSKELIKSHFWPIFGRLILLGLISVVISSVQYVTPSFFVVQAIQTVILTVVNFILSFYGIIYTYLIYKDLTAK